MTTDRRRPPMADGTDRASVPWARHVAGGLALFAVVALSACQVEAGGQRTFDPGVLGDEIAADLSRQLGGDFRVECPTGQLMAAGAFFECRAFDELGRTGVIAVVAIDDRGNVEWELIDVLSADGDTSTAPPEVSVDDPAFLGGGASIDLEADVPSSWIRHQEASAGRQLIVWHPADWTSRTDYGHTQFRNPASDPADAVSVTFFLGRQMSLPSGAGETYRLFYAMTLANRVEHDAWEVVFEEEVELVFNGELRHAMAAGMVRLDDEGDALAMLFVVANVDDADPNEQVFLAFQYQSPLEDTYHRYLDTALTMLAQADVVPD